MIKSSKFNIGSLLPINFTWLASSQCANIIVPLLIYPYLLRIIGIEHFGSIIFAQGVAFFIAGIVDYGFSVSAVREIAISRDNRKALSTIFSEVFVVKAVVFLISGCLLIVMLYLLPSWDQIGILLLFSLTIVAGQMIMPFWFFQGLEKMQGITAMTFASKAIFIVLVLFFIREKPAYIYVNLFLGLSYFIVGLISTAVIFYNHRILPVWVSIGNLLARLTKNKEIFLSQLSINLYGNANIIILGLVSDPLNIGYYAVVEKILLAGKAPAVLLYQTIFPKVCRLSGVSITKLESFLSGVLKLVFLFFIPLGVLIFFFSGHLTQLFTGHPNSDISSLLKIVSFIPLFVALNIPAAQTLLAYNFKSTYLNVSTISMVVSLIAGYILIYNFGALGAAINIVLIEVLSTVLLFGSLTYSHREYSMLKLFKLT